MSNKGIRSLIGDPHKLSTERGRAELRAGRPIRLRDRGSPAAIVFAFEGLDEAIYEAFRAAGASIRLVLSAARLRHLKMGVDAPGSVDMTAYGFHFVHSLVLEEDAKANIEVELASPLETAALELVRLSLLLPAALVIEGGQLEDIDLITVEAEAVRRFEDEGVASLRLVSRSPVPLEGVEKCSFAVFRGGHGLREQVAVIIGDPDPDEAVLLRIHSACLTGDLFGSLKCDCGEQLRGAVQRMAAEGGGVLLYLDQEGRGNGIANKIRAYCLQHDGHDTYDADEILGFENDHRRFDIAAAMLRQLGFSAVRLMTNNPLKIKALQEAGLRVAATQRIFAHTNGHNAGYIAAKRDRAGHLFEPDLIETTLPSAAAGGKH